MEAQLAEYRKRKEKERRSQQSIFKRLFTSSKTQSQSEHITAGIKANLNSTTENTGNEKSDQPSPPPQPPPLVQSVQSVEQFYSDWKCYIPLCLYVILWFVLWKFFIEIGFGAVYFIVSCSYLMYRNTRTGPRESNRLSAYSVFNPNHERLDGTFTAEQFEKEMRFGAGSVR